MYTIRYHNYICHPETCNHANHSPWFLTNKNGDSVDKFDSKEVAIDYCELTNKRYKVHELTWEVFYEIIT